MGLPLLAAIVMFVLALAGIELTREGGRLASVWLANGALAVLHDSATSEPLAHWLFADILGILILTPLLVTLCQARGDQVRGSLLEYVLLLVAAAIITARVFSRELPFIFLIAPMLMLAGAEADGNSRRLAAALHLLAAEVASARQALAVLHHQTITQLVHA